jgi:hypothetical protein
LSKTRDTSAWERFGEVIVVAFGVTSIVLGVTEGIRELVFAGFLCVVLGMYFVIAPLMDLPLPPTRTEWKARKKEAADKVRNARHWLEKFTSQLEVMEERGERELEAGYRTNRHTFLLQLLRRAPGREHFNEETRQAFERLKALAAEDDDAVSTALNAENPADGGRVADEEQRWFYLRSEDRERLSKIIDRSKDLRFAISEEIASREGEQ